MVEQSGASKRAAGRGFRALWVAGSDADGSRHAVVEHESGNRVDVANGVDGKAGDPIALQRIPSSTDARQSGALSPIAGRSDTAAWIAQGTTTPTLAGSYSLSLHHTP